MGKVLSIMVRQSRRVFVQERADRIISKPKPKMHPYYPTEEKIMKQIKAGYPELTEKLREHTPALDERVGTIKISSKEVPQLDDGGGIPKIARPTSIEGGAKISKDVRLLPQARMAPLETDSGFYEPPPEKVARGRILFSKAMELLETSAKDPERSFEMAKQLGLADNDAKSILGYYVQFTKFVDLPDETPKEQEPDVLEREAIGRRAFLQKQRIVSDLEQSRITAKLASSAESSQDPKKLKEPETDDRKT